MDGEKQAEQRCRSRFFRIRLSSHPSRTGQIDEAAEERRCRGRFGRWRDDACAERLAIALVTAVAAAAVAAAWPA